MQLAGSSWQEQLAGGSWQGAGDRMQVVVINEYGKK